MKQFPNLYVLGAAKCGTTSLHYYLAQHPDICMSVPKEPFFFEAEYERGIDYYCDKYFSHWSGQPVVGDARHRNLYLPFVLPRIKECAHSDAKFLVIVRHPVDRAYSHWWHNYSRGIEKKSFADAIESNFRRLEVGPFFESEPDAALYKKTFDYKSGSSPYESYVDSGFYAEQIRRFVDAFGVKKVKVLFLDDLMVNPKMVMTDVFQFIGVNDNQHIDYSKNNEALSMAGINIFTFLKKLPGRKLFPKPLRAIVSNKIQEYFRGEKQAGLIPNDMRGRLLAIYAPHTSELEHMTGRMLDNWRL